MSDETLHEALSVIEAAVMDNDALVAKVQELEAKVADEHAKFEALKAETVAAELKLKELKDKAVELANTLVALTDSFQG